MHRAIQKFRTLTDEEEARIQKGIAEDPENPEWTEEDFKNAKPFAEVFPEFAESIRRARGRPVVEARKRQISLRLDPDVIDAFKATGKGWQGRINEALRKAAKL
ncbi:BrnA antitoxin family protein [Rhizobium tubonense]|uniref:BrnA antitoxin family protein n=1 Tax=Rhizobium tubonense TaxID=484088 RepID=A0A2W4CFA1_9HYPH|nr:BrnA antitoxin family protein [Rhizobium tubonense]PZM11897.1 hypothetical protein CPY51_17430 [Rhizobium tubonense]